MLLVKKDKENGKIIKSFFFVNYQLIVYKKYVILFLGDTNDGYTNYKFTS